MKAILFTTLVLSLTACSSGGSHPVLPTPASPSAPPSSIDPIVVPPPPPGIVPPPPALTYDCTNHPLSGKAVVNDANAYNIAFRPDCTYTFSDASHMSYGVWSPNPTPGDVTTDTDFTYYPMHFTVTGSYVCLPASGPQTCSNDAFAGDVTVRVRTSNKSVGLLISN